MICHDPLSSEETKALDCGHIFHSDVSVNPILAQIS